MGGAHSLHLHGDGRVQNDEAFSAEDHQRLLDAISEAHMSCASKPEILMLWEMPGLAAVFQMRVFLGPSCLVSLQCWVTSNLFAKTVVMLRPPLPSGRSPLPLNMQYLLSLGRLTT